MDIQSLHSLIDTNVTQQTPTDRIVGAEVRQVDHAITDEVAARGMVNGVDTGNLDLYTRSESGHVLIPNQGILIPLQSDSPPDNIHTFPSGEAGWLWQKAVTFVKINPAGNNVELGSSKYKFIIDDISNTVKIKKPVPDNMDYMLLDLVNENYTIGRSEGLTRMVLHSTDGMHISAYSPTTTIATGISSLHTDVIRPSMYMMMSVPVTATDARVAMFLNVASVQSHVTITNRKLSFHVHDTATTPVDVNYFLVDATPGARLFQFGDTTENDFGMLMEFRESLTGSRMDWRVWGSRMISYDDGEAILYLGDADTQNSGMLLTVNQNNTGVRIHNYGVVKVQYDGGTDSFDISSKYFTMMKNSEAYVSFDTNQQIYRIGREGKSQILINENIPYINIKTVPAAGGYGSSIGMTDTSMDIYFGPRRLVYGSTTQDRIFVGDHNTGVGMHLAIELNNITKEIIFYTDIGHLVKMETALVNRAGALAGTLNNAPAAGDPTKWISINDAGTIRRIPTW